MSREDNFFQNSLDNQLSGIIFNRQPFYWALLLRQRAFTRQHKGHLPASINVVKTVADSPSSIDIVKTVGMIQPTVSMFLRQWHLPGSINIVKTMSIHPVVLIL